MSCRNLKSLMLMVFTELVAKCLNCGGLSVIKVKFNKSLLKVKVKVKYGILNVQEKVCQNCKFYLNLTNIQKWHTKYDTLQMS